MDAFISRKRRKITMGAEEVSATHPDNHRQVEQSTDEKLAILSSIFEDRPQEILFEALLDCDGSVERALDVLLNASSVPVSTVMRQKRQASNAQGVQSALRFGRIESDLDGNADGNVASQPKSITKKGKTIYLYTPSDIAKHTPCSIIHNFLPTDLANALLRELLPETESFTSATFRLFDNIVQSPHTASFYVNNLADAEVQKANYLYNGSTLSDVREILPTMRHVSELVREATNSEIEKRIKSHYPGGQKLQYQPQPGTWTPNAAFVNCYDGPQQSVGWHTDQLTYLGPHAVIGSLSLGVQREFRIRRIVPPPDTDRMSEAEATKAKDEAGDAQGQISLPLPHNSLLIMHAEMQEEWKHSVAATKAITTHPIAGRKRVNITYRWYRPEFEPRFTPRCRCTQRVTRQDGHGSEIVREEGVPCVLKSVMKRKQTKGKYVWMCQTQGGVGPDAKVGPVAVGTGDGTKGCGYFEWAEFDDDGVPAPSLNTAKKS